MRRPTRLHPLRRAFSTRQRPPYYTVAPRPTVLTNPLHLPLNQCSDAAADAVCASESQVFPEHFDLVATGGGLAGFYGGAVTSVLATLKRRGVLQVGQLYGVSSGALVCATYLGCESGFTKLEDVYRCHECFVHGKWLSYAMRQFLDECLPPDVHERASGRMHVTVSEMLAPEHLLPRKRVISHFDSRPEFLDAVMASTIIPGITAPRPHACSPDVGGGNGGSSSGSVGGDGGASGAAATTKRVPPWRRGYMYDGVKVVAPPPTPQQPQLHIKQMAAARRLRYPKRWLLKLQDADVDVTLALPALKDTVRLLTQRAPLPHQAMAFLDGSTPAERRVAAHTSGHVALRAAMRDVRAA